MSSRIDAREMQYMPITLGELHATSAVEVPHTEDCLFSFDEDMLAIREVFAADTGEHEPITSDPHFSGGYLTNDISARVQDEHVAMRSSGPYEVITRPSVDPQWQTTLRDEEDDLSSCIPMTSLKRFDTIDQEMIKLFQVHDDNPPAPHPEVTDSSDDETNLSENSKRTFSIATTNEKSNPKKWIDHTYIDFSLVEQQHLLGNRSPQGSTLKAVLEANPDCITLKHGKFQGSINFPTNFPYKMMEILSRPEIKNIIDWRPHGRSFIIYHPEKMENKVLVFSKYKSFVRSLNMWGFKRITRGPDAGSYYHQVRANAHKCDLYCRKISRFIILPFSFTFLCSCSCEAKDFYCSTCNV